MIFSFMVTVGIHETVCCILTGLKNVTFNKSEQVAQEATCMEVFV